MAPTPGERSARRMTLVELDALIAAKRDAYALLLTWNDWIALMGGRDEVEHRSHLASGQAVYRGLLVWIALEEPSCVLNAQEASQFGLNIS